MFHVSLSSIVSLCRNSVPNTLGALEDSETSPHSRQDLTLHFSITMKWKLRMIRPEKGLSLYAWQKWAKKKHSNYTSSALVLSSLRVSHLSNPGPLRLAYYPQPNLMALTSGSSQGEEVLCPFTDSWASNCATKSQCYYFLWVMKRQISNWSQNH